MVAIAPTQSNVTQAIGQFLQSILGYDTSQIIVGQQNRVAEPKPASFVVMTPIRFERLATNLDGNADVKFTGSIAATTLTVTDVAFGAIDADALLFGTGVTAGTSIVEQTSGSPGGVGVYTIMPSQTVGSETLSCGAKTLTQTARVTVQIDFHSQGADQTAGDNAQAASTLFRDEFGVNFFATLAAPLNGIVPLYADDPRQTPFQNDQAQIEWRWSLDAQFEVDETVSVPQTYADAAVVTPISVEAAYPAN